MTGIDNAALVILTGWVAILTLVVVLLIRQIGLIVAKLEHLGTFSVTDDGPAIGDAVPNDVMDALPDPGGETHHLLLISAGCGPCRELARDLKDTRLTSGVTALVPGRPELVGALRDLMPDEVRFVRDPDASEVSSRLRIRSTPFYVRLDDRRVTSKGFVRTAEELVRLIESGAIPAAAREAADASEEAISVGR